MSLADDIRNGNLKKKKLQPLDLTSESKAKVEKLRQIRQAQKPQQTQHQSQPQQQSSVWDRINGAWNRLNYINKNIKTGMTGGIVGLGQAELTDTANEMQKGRKENYVNLATKYITSIMPMNTINSFFNNQPEITKKDIELLKDKNKNTLEKIVGIGLNRTSGAKQLSPGYATKSITEQIIGKSNPHIGNTLLSWNDKISKPLEEKQQELAKEGKQYGGTTRFLGEAGQTIGYMLPSTAASIMTKNPNVGLGMMALSAKGQATQNALNSMIDKEEFKKLSPEEQHKILDKAVSIGDTKGGLEYLTEIATGGVKVFGGGSKAEEMLRKQIKDKVKNKVFKKLANLGLDIAGESIEEDVANITDMVIDRGTTDPNATYSLEDWGKSKGITSLTTAVLNGLGFGASGISKRLRGQTYTDVNTGQRVDKGTQNVLEQFIINKINKTENANTQQQELTPTMQDLTERVNNSNLAEETKQSMIQDINKGINQEQYNQMRELIDMNENNQETNVQLPTKEQAILPTKEQTLPIQNKIQITNEDNLITSAKKYGYDFKNKNLEEMQQVLDKRGIKGQFNENYFVDNEGNIDTDIGALWNITTDENGNVTRSIILNPNANENTIIQEMEIHELLHDVLEGKTKEANDLYNDILDYMKQENDYANVRKELEDLYSQKYDRNADNFQQIIDEEVVAKALQTKFGNQEEISRLVKYNPTKARSIYDKVVSKVNNLFQKYNGDSKLLNKAKDYIFWKNVQNKFEYAYSQEGNYKDVKNTNKNVIKSIDDNRLYTHNDNSRQVDTSDLTTAGNKVARYINDNIRKNQDVIIKAIDGDDLTITKNTAYKIASRDNVKNKNGKFKPLSDELYGVKLRAGLYIDEIAKTSKSIGKLVPDTKNHKFAKDGFKYRKAYFMDNDGQYYSMNLSVGKNGEVNSIYNLGKIKEAEFPQVAQRPDSKTISEAHASSKYSIPQNQENVKYSLDTDGAMKDNKTGKKVVLNAESNNDGKNLLAIHNLDEAKLKGVLELGGFPVPSIAITNPDIVSHDQFGDISVIFNKETINPENSVNEVYDRDVWSPTFPQIDYQINKDNSESIAKDLGIESWRLEDYAEDSRNPDDMVEKLLRNSDEIVDKYIKDNKLKYETKYREAELHKWYNKQDSVKTFIKENNITIDKLINDETTRQKYFEALKNEFNKDSDEIEGINNQIEIINHFLDDSKKSGEILDRLKGLENDLNLIINNKTSVVDEYETKKSKRDVAKENGIEDYIKEKIFFMFGERGIRNNLDPFTPSGNKRSFWALHDEYNIDNIIKAMTNQDTISSQNSFMTGFGKINAQMSRKFDSISDIKANENRLTPDVDNEVIEKYRDAVGDDISDIAEYYKYSDESSFNMQGFTNASEAVFDLAKSGDLTEDNFRKILEENIINSKRVPTKIINRVINNLNSLKDLKTDYFEAKPQRAVGFDEVDAIIIPKDLSKEVKQQLKDRGIKTIEYDSNNETERADILKSLNEYKFSKTNESFDEYLTRRIGKEGTRTSLKDLKLPTKQQADLPTNNKVQFNNDNNISEGNKMSDTEVAKTTTKKTLNPTEISNIKPEDMNTTPKLPNKNYSKGNKQSSFVSNILTDAKFLNEDLRQEMAKEENVRYYQGITNAETLEKAYNSLSEGGEKETVSWFTKDSKDVTAEDVAKGWILLKQYQDAGDYQSAVEVAKKMRDMGTKAGQAVQAYNMMARLTPEGMYYYAQSELNEAFNKAIEGKSQKWIEANRDNFELTPEETNFIKETMNEVAQMEDGYDKKVKLAEIQKVITDKIPPTSGQSIKAWMRISMLFNPKTQVRNIMGNTVILPVNMGSDFISSGIDKIISKKTGVRTTGNMNLKNYGKGFGKGLYESYNDFRKGINTRNIEGNRFEVSEGNSFKNKGIGKALNRVDNILSFSLDAGDRGFYEGSFVNSINNQMVLNNVEQATPDMIEIATNEALQRTWQDNNRYTEAVLKIRGILNNVNVKGYGLGDVLIPFAKTPANLTKAIVDYSPIGLTKTLTLDAKKFNNSLHNGQYSPQLQHNFVQSLGKGMAGSFLYVLGYGLASAGIASGEADDDKDVKNFMKNSLGISSYSIKVGDKSFTYDWAQPVAVPLAIATNYVKYSKDNPDANAIEKAVKSLDIGSEQLLQQSFMESLNTVLNGTGTTMENLTKTVLDLPARAIPTFSKQIADMVDEKQRTTFEYDKPVQSAINSALSKIPGASTLLPVSRDTLGNEIEKYGGENNIFNVMFNPANVNKGKLSKAGEEIYRLYQETGDTNVFPITAPYYINNKGEKINMTAEERNKFQKVAGQYTEKAVKELLTSSGYKKLNDTEKADLISDITKDSNEKAKYKVLNIESKQSKQTREAVDKLGAKIYYDYKGRVAQETTKQRDSGAIEPNASINYKDKIKILLNSDYTNRQRTELYESFIKNKPKEGSLDKYKVIKSTDMDINEYLKYCLQDFESDKKDDGTLNGKTIDKSKQKKIVGYLNSMNITGNQRLLLYALHGYATTKQQKSQLVNYVQSLDLDNDNRLRLYNRFSGFTAYKNGTVKIK